MNGAARYDEARYNKWINDGGIETFYNHVGMESATRRRHDGQPAGHSFGYRIVERSIDESID